MGIITHQSPIETEIREVI